MNRCRRYDAHVADQAAQYIWGSLGYDNDRSLSRCKYTHCLGHQGSPPGAVNVHRCPRCSSCSGYSFEGEINEHIGTGNFACHSDHVLVTPHRLKSTFFFGRRDTIALYKQASDRRITQNVNGVRPEKKTERHMEEHIDGHEIPTPKITSPCVAFCEATILLPWRPLVSRISVVGEVPLALGHTTASIGARPCVPPDKHIWYKTVIGAEVSITKVECTRAGGTTLPCRPTLFTILQALVLVSPLK